MIKELVPEEEVGMGGKENRVYWPVGMEEWLRPKKREVKKKNNDDEDEMFRNPTPANFAARKVVRESNRAPLSDEVKETLREVGSVADVQRILEGVMAERVAAELEEEKGGNEQPKKKVKRMPAKEGGNGAMPKKPASAKKKKVKEPPTPSLSNVDDEEEGLSMPDLSSEDDDELGDAKRNVTKGAAPARQSGRARTTKATYVEPDADADEDDEE